MTQIVDTATPCNRPVGQLNLAFDYRVLDPEVAIAARDATNRILSGRRNDMVDTGCDLVAVSARMEHGAFGAWIKAELNRSARTAENYMSAAHFLAEKRITVSHLAATSICALAAPSAPAAAVSEVLGAIEAGAAIPAAQIKAKVATAIQAERHAVIEAKKSQDQIEKERKARKTKAQREAPRVAELEAQMEKRKLAERDHTDRLRPLAARIIAAVGRDLSEMLCALDDHKDKSLAVRTAESRRGRDRSGGTGGIGMIRRRRGAAKDREAPVNRAEVIRLAHHFLANAATPTATGATVFLPDGSELFVSAEVARALHGEAKPGGGRA